MDDGGFERVTHASRGSTPPPSPDGEALPSPPPAPTPPSPPSHLAHPALPTSRRALRHQRTRLRETEERIEITQDRIDGGSLTCSRAGLLDLRRELCQLAARLRESIAGFESALALASTTLVDPATPKARPQAQAQTARMEQVDACYLYESTAATAEGAPRARSRSPPPCRRAEPDAPRLHDRRGWRSRAPWRHADGARAVWSRASCRAGGAGCTQAPCIRVAYGEGKGRSRSGPASILWVVSPARPPT